MSEIWGIPSPKIEGPKTTFLGRLRNLRANLTAYIFGLKQDIDNRSRALTTTMGLLYIVPKCMVHNFGPQTASNSTCILPTR